MGNNRCLWETIGVYGTQLVFMGHNKCLWDTITVYAIKSVYATQEMFMRLKFTLL